MYIWLLDSVMFKPVNVSKNSKAVVLVVKQIEWKTQKLQIFKKGASDRDIYDFVPERGRRYQEGKK